jgi:hypothetical protein
MASHLSQQQQNLFIRFQDLFRDHHPCYPVTFLNLIINYEKRGTDYRSGTKQERLQRLSSSLRASSYLITRSQFRMRHLTSWKTENSSSMHGTRLSHEENTVSHPPLLSSSARLLIHLLDNAETTEILNSTSKTETQIYMERSRLTCTINHTLNTN